MNQMGRNTAALLFAAVRCNGNEAVTAASITAYAARQWGTRVVAALDEMGMLRPAFYCGQARFRILAGS